MTDEELWAEVERRATYRLGERVRERAVRVRHPTDLSLGEGTVTALAFDPEDGWRITVLHNRFGETEEFGPDDLERMGDADWTPPKQQAY